MDIPNENLNTLFKKITNKTIKEQIKDWKGLSPADIDKNIVIEMEENAPNKKIFTEDEIEKHFNSFQNTTGKRLMYEGYQTEQEEANNTKKFLDYIDSPETRQCMKDSTCDLIIKIIKRKNNLE